MAARPAATVADVLRTRRGELTPAEHRVARALLADYPSAGLQPVSALARAAGVSAPTVVRLVAKLGWDGYPAVQAQLRAELSARTAAPVERLAAGRGERSSVLDRVARSVGEATDRAVRDTDPAEFDRAVELVADRDRPVFVAGGRVSDALAGYLARTVSLLRPGVRVVAPDPSARAVALLDVRRGATVVVYDYRRYDAGVVELGREAARRGARIVLFTDPYLSPLASVATVLLTGGVEGPPPFVTLTPAMALTEALVLGVLERSGVGGRKRLAAFDRWAEGVPR